MSAPHSSSLKGSRRAVVEFSKPPPQGGRCRRARAARRRAAGSRLPRHLRQLLDEIEERRLAPVHVVEDDDERSSRGQRFEEPAQSRETLVAPGNRLCQADCVDHGLRDEIRVFLGAEQLHQAGSHSVRWLAVTELGDVLDRFDDRPERDALAIRKAPALRDGRPTPDVLEELVDETRLADTGGAQNREQLARTVINGELERVLKPAALPLTADHRRVEPPHAARKCVDDLDEANQFGRPVDGLDEHCVSNEPLVASSSTTSPGSAA